VVSAKGQDRRFFSALARTLRVASAGGPALDEEGRVCSASLSFFYRVEAFLRHQKARKPFGGEAFSLHDENV
jgi:hypothetical protein